MDLDFRMDYFHDDHPFKTIHLCCDLKYFIFNNVMPFYILLQQYSATKVNQNSLSECMLCL